MVLWTDVATSTTWASTVLQEGDKGGKEGKRDKPLDLVRGEHTPPLHIAHTHL